MSRLDSQDLGMQGYQYEPEYSEEELASMDTNTESTDVATNSEIQDEDATQYRHERLTDLETWCICSNCCLMPTVEESKCCTEYLACEAKMPDGQQGQCITTHPKFATVCIDDTVLDLTISIVHDFRGNVADGEHSNDASFRYFRHAMALIYATDEINRSQDLLPNITLGYQIYDSCTSQIKAVHATLSILSKQRDMMPNYSCTKKVTFIGLVGDLSSATSFSIAQLLARFKYPQVSFGALDPLFSDKLRFPSFYRTVPSEVSQYVGMAQLLKHFGWTWIGILTSEDDRGERALRELKKEIALLGVCVEFSYTIPTVLKAAKFLEMQRITAAVIKCTARVIIVYSSTTKMTQYFMSSWEELPSKIWIISATLSAYSTNAFGVVTKPLNITLSFSIKKGEIEGFREFLRSISPAVFPHDEALENQWQRTFVCKLMNRINRINRIIERFPDCSGNESLVSLDSPLFDVYNFRFSYSAYTAAYTLAHALHKMLLLDSGPEFEMGVERLKQNFSPWKLNKFLKNLHFKTPAGDVIAFDDAGDVPARYDIVNWFSTPKGNIESFLVGGFDSSVATGHQLSINPSAIQWPHDALWPNKTPRSVCSESCPPGSRKAPIKERPPCCFDCVPCADGEYSSMIDMETCLQCPEHQWPNAKKDGCIRKVIIFLSYDDTLGMSAACVAIAFSIATAGVLGLFVKHRDTPLVKANNRTLSYALLASLMLSFLCSLLFIGRPASWTCLIQQSAFGIIFTVAVSCVLAKTITVVIAFNATKPSSRSSRFLGSKMSGSLVLLCTLGEVGICLPWLLTAPPHPHTDVKSETGHMILQCDQGSATAFYSVIGYMGGLAFASFVLAFLSRNLPDRFNEAQLITFSMLVFCSVWVSFIPAYLSSKGMYMVAVEIFAILASSAGLLGCIFIPKCYILLLRPEENTRTKIDVKTKI